MRAKWVCGWAMAAVAAGFGAANADELPTADDVVAKHVAALGGKEALEKSKSSSAKGKFSVPGQGLEGDLNVVAARPNKLRVDIKLPGLGNINAGYDGKVAWEINPLSGPRVLDGKALEQMKEDADYNDLLFDKKNYESIKVTGKEEFEGAPAFVLELKRKSGSVRTAYFNAKTNLIVGYRGTQTTPMGEVEVLSVFSDWKKFGDLNVPTKTIQRIGPIEQVMTIESLEYNEVPAKAFDLPPEIKALLEKDDK